MKKVCFFHGADLDGICSAAIIKVKHPDTILYPVDYGRDIGLDGKVEPGDEVIIVDYTLQPFNNMVLLNDIVDLTWVDHHDTTMNEYGELLKECKIKEIKGLRDNTKAACELTWEYLHPGTYIPYPVWLLGRFDIWHHHESESVLPFQYGMRAIYRPPDDIEFWSNIFSAKRDSSTIQSTIRNGEVVIEYERKINEKVCGYQIFRSEFLNYKCICINRAFCGSQVFESVKDIDDYDIMVVFYVCAKGSWNVSLYTRKENIHVGNIAKLYGGGGHAEAAGFKCSLLPFEVSN